MTGKRTVSRNGCVCVVCQKEFTRAVRRGRPQITCGRACLEVRLREREQKRWCASKQVKNCLQCGEQFTGLKLICGDACRKARRRAQAATPERRQRKSRQYQEKRDEWIARTREYQEKRREQIREYRARYYRENYNKRRAQIQAAKKARRQLEDQAQLLIEALTEAWEC